MKYLDFTTLLEGDPARAAFLSTFQFDPDYFERRLMRCSALARARRIVVFLDGGQWLDLLRRDVPARWLNRRYLVVPVQRSQGVFHPKLNLLLSETGGQVLCGSNNLTRSGCSSNLELLNSVPFSLDDESAEGSLLAQEAFKFFAQAARNTDDEIVRIAGEWIEETAETFCWLKNSIPEFDRKVRLLHTYDGSIWRQLVDHLADDKLRSFFVISPFHDADGEICRRLASQWPQAKIELLVQQGYTSLAVNPLKNLRNVQLSELCESSRRIHAKLIAWRSDNGSGCLVGSANFTSAALDGRNVEACFLISKTDELVDTLFDRRFSKRPLALDDFIPGEAASTSPEPTVPLLRINSAVLAGANQLRVRYAHQLEPAPRTLRLTIRAPGETHPRASMSIPKNSSSTETVLLADNALADSHGTLLASLVAQVDGSKVESPAVWIIQECRLTYEPSEGASSSNGRIEDTGEGLPEFLDDLGKRNGLSAVVDYLRGLNIRFQGGGAGVLGQRKFRLKVRDPFQADIAPAWLIEARVKSDDLEEAIYEFVERHVKRRLHKHVTLGNINGMENFLDILTTLVRLLYVYYKRGVVKRGRLIGYACMFIELATIGRETESEQFDGFLYSVYDSLGGDLDLLQEVCNEARYLAEVSAVLLIVQSIRFDPEESVIDGPRPTRPRDVLKRHANAVATAMSECRLTAPSAGDVQRALEDYKMFSESEIARLIAELPL